jgi:hypothetical protein
MSTSEPRAGEGVKHVRFTEDCLVVDRGGFGIHWPDIDEDLSTAGLLRGSPAPRVSAAPSRKR